jgi:hypothetical protein
VFLRRTSDADEAGEGGSADGGGDDRAAAARQELFARAPAPDRRPPGTRTADEIRAAYGRPLPSRASRASAATAASLADTRDALAARGERLEGLAVATDALSADAAGFEVAARAIRERAERKWWKI